MICLSFLPAPSSNESFNTLLRSHRKGVFKNGAVELRTSPLGAVRLERSPLGFREWYKLRHRPGEAHWKSETELQTDNSSSCHLAAAARRVASRRTTEPKSLAASRQRTLHHSGNFRFRPRFVRFDARLIKERNCTAR